MGVYEMEEKVGCRPRDGRGINCCEGILEQLGGLIEQNVGAGKATFLGLPWHCKNHRLDGYAVL